MDYLIKALALNGQVRVYVCRTKNLVNEAINRGDVWPSAAAVLGKTMTIAVIMGSMLKGSEALTIKVNGNGPIGNVIADSNADGEVRGYVDNPHIHFSNSNNSLNEEMTLGDNGHIDVIKDLKLKDLFTSSIPLETSNLAYAFTYYFATSEQTPSLVSLGSKIETDNNASQFGGIVIQLLPNAIETAIAFLEERANSLNNFSVLLEKYTLEEILNFIFKDDYKIVQTMPLKFKCDCSKEKFAGGIASLGISEIKEMIADNETLNNKETEIVCHYCKERYTYSKQELENIIERITKNDKQRIYS